MKESRLTVVVVQLLLHTPHEMHLAGLEPVFGFLGIGSLNRRKDLRVDKVHQRSKQPLVAAMGCRSHHEYAPTIQREDPTDAVVRLRGWGQSVRLVEDDEVPAGAIGVYR